MKCKRHPEIETNLTCAKCGDPICPKCLVYTPVGARCRTCAKLSRVPTYRVPKTYYLRAAGAAIGAALVIGIVWGFLQKYVGFFYLNLLLAAGVGYVIGEAISLSVNRKSGTGLAVIGGLAVLLCYYVSTFTFWGLNFHLIDIVGIVIGIIVAVARLR
jgi:hypothetical protein